MEPLGGDRLAPPGVQLCSMSAGVGVTVASVFLACGARGGASIL